MSVYMLPLEEADRTKHNLVGGKAASLGDLTRIDGVPVPSGFSVTTEVYKEIIINNSSFQQLLRQLVILKTDNRQAIIEISARIRKLIEDMMIPQNIREEISYRLSQMGETNAYAVRS